ncbi:hypothetical protein ACOZGD_33325 [Streptomyces murinus]
MTCSTANPTDPSGSGSPDVGCRTTVSAPGAGRPPYGLGDGGRVPGDARAGPRALGDEIGPDPFGDARAGGGRQIHDHPVRLRAPGRRPALLDEPAGLEHTVRGGGGGEQRASAPDRRGVRRGVRRGQRSDAGPQPFGRELGPERNAE